jgi:hypothetical protein
MFVTDIQQALYIDYCGDSQAHKAGKGRASLSDNYKKGYDIADDAIGDFLAAPSEDEGADNLASFCDALDH